MTPEELKRAREIAEKCLVKRDNEAKRSLQEWAEHPPIFIMDIEAITLAEAVLYLSEAVKEAEIIVEGYSEIYRIEFGNSNNAGKTWLSKWGEK